MNVKISSATTAPVDASTGNYGNSSALGILQTINELRQEEYFIDIHVEVREAKIHRLIIYNAGLEREDIRGTQSCPRSPFPRPQEPSYSQIGIESFYHQFDALFRKVSPCL